ncbi:nucleotidyltransferase family protein [Nocardioides bizhenqiangii]|uniref:Nucleotidyltransferase family protein n=1 Tax=Nocardioides bizhenqiangii TaxID=3095076 RepID=A0ABZ0ZPU7_9ACTN|nr:nucleotidyltransferase family protein [Nocardioides sp. HM61]WQQ25971.1 nucleotidyltransferase family protein [Nocardioides sp. HM61]
MLTPAAVSEVRRAVRAALALEDGDATVRWTWRARVPESDFVDAVERHRATMVLADHVDVLGLPTAVRREVVAQRDRERMGALAQIRLTAAVDGLLAGVDHLFFKGVALAALTTGDPGARGDGDVDVMVSPDRLADAARALQADGWTVRPTYTSDQTSWAWRYQRWGAHEMAYDRDGQTIDLHWRLDPTYDGLPGFADLWARRERVRIGPVAVDTLGSIDAFAHTLRHAAKDGWESLRSLVDVHRLARDPALAGLPVDRVAAATLSATEAAIGLPACAPPFTRSSAPLPRLLAAQASPVRHATVPGQRTVRQAGFRWRTSRTPRDLCVNAVTLLLPPASTAAIAERDPVKAIALAAQRRVREVAWKLSGWRTEVP